MEENRTPWWGKLLLLLFLAYLLAVLGLILWGLWLLGEWLLPIMYGWTQANK